MLALHLDVIQSTNWFMTDTKSSCRVMMYLHRAQKPRPRLGLRSIGPAAQAMHDQMYTAFAEYVFTFTLLRHESAAGAGARQLYCLITDSDIFT